MSKIYITFSIITSFLFGSSCSYFFLEEFSKSKALAYKVKVLSLLEGKENIEAIFFISRAIERNPDDYHSFALLGGLYEAEGEEELALRAYKNSIYIGNAYPSDEFLYDEKKLHENKVRLEKSRTKGSGL